MKKRGLATLLVLCMVLALVPVTAEAAGNFPRTATYQAGQFSDVAADNWFAGAVKDCYELGLMSGVGAGAFSPSGKFTVAQALTVAARLHNMFRGGNGVIPSAPGSWYAGAVNYCLEKGIITEEEFKGSYLRTATRGEMAHLIRAAMPEDALAEKNQVTDLPDVSSSDMYYKDILRLYQAGIVGGSDKLGSFKPYSSITRAEVATIVARSVLAEQRLTLKLTPYTTNGNALPIYAWNYKDYSESDEYSEISTTMSCGRMAFCDSADENNNNKKWGYLDSLGNVVIPAQYARVEAFREGRAIVEIMDGKRGVIDTDGKAIIPLEYSSVRWYSSAKLDELEAGKYKWKNGNYLAYKGKNYALFQADGKKLVENQGVIYALGEGTFGLDGNDKTPARLYVQGTVVSIPGMKDSPREKISGKDVFYKKIYSGGGSLEGYVVVTVSGGKATVYENVTKLSEKSPLMVVEEGGKYYLWNMLTNKRVCDQGADSSDDIRLLGDAERYKGTDLAVIPIAPNGYDTVSYLVNPNGLLGEYAGSFSGGDSLARQAVDEYIKAEGGFKKIWDSYEYRDHGTLAFGTGWVKGINPDGKLWIITWEDTGPESWSRNKKLTVKVEGEQVFELQWGEVLQGSPTPNIFVLPDGSGHILREEQQVMIPSSTVEGNVFVTQPGVNFNTYAGKDASFAKCFENGERFKITVKNEWKKETKDGKTYQNLYRVTTYTDQFFYFNGRSWWIDKTPIRIGGVTIDPPPERTSELVKSIDVSAYKEVVSLGEDCFMGRIDSAWYMIRK